MKNTFKKIIAIVILTTFISSNVQAAVTIDSTTGTGNINSTTYIPPNDNAIPVQSGANILIGGGDTNSAINAGLGNNPYNPNSPNLNPTVVNAQIQNSVLATRPATTTQQTPASNTAIGVASCLGSQIVSQAIVGAVTSFGSTAISKVTDSILNVPTAESGSVGASIKTETSARIGTSIDLFGFSIPALPSWDSMAYCIVNTMIIYIADSTIQWINTGFDGNPAFLNNPDQFFEDLANQEKIAFLQGLAYGVNSSICGVFKNSVVSAILSRYGKNQQMYGQPGYDTGGYYGGGLPTGAMSSCPFDQTPGKLNVFLTGGFDAGGGWDTWFQVTQNPLSNPYDTYFNTNDRLNSQVEAIKISNERELNWNNGYLSFRKCENGEKDKSKCSITTPGTVIQNQLNSTLNLGKNRLVLAEKFDQVVTAVVDQLITTAIDKALDRESYGSSNSYNSTGYNNAVNYGTSSPWNSQTIQPYTGQQYQNTNFPTTTTQVTPQTGRYIFSTSTNQYIYVQ